MAKKSKAESEAEVLDTPKAPDSASLIDGPVPDTQHGFQNEPGFDIDEVVGELTLTVVRCHSDRNPSPKERVILLTPNGTLRVHDFIMVRRAHGKIIPGDVWTFGESTETRVRNILSRLMLGAREQAFELIKKAFGKAL
jgi:hypothetical protein